jgi:uncharacterized protein (TIGR02271 family)
MTDASKNSDPADMDDALEGTCVVDVAGCQARIISVQKSGPNQMVILQPDNGAQVMVPLSLLNVQDDNQYRLPFSFSSLSDDATGQSQVVIPVIEEQLQIGKRVVDTGKGIRIRKSVSEQEQIVDPPLLQDELLVEHVPVGKVLDASELPTTRYDGDTLVVPIFEEVLVVQKQMRLKEEVHITRRRSEVHAPQTVVLKSEQVSVEHFDEHGSVPYPGSSPRSTQQVKSEPGKSAG